MGDRVHAALMKPSLAMRVVNFFTEASSPVPILTHRTLSGAAPELAAKGFDGLQKEIELDDASSLIYFDHAPRCTFTLPLWLHPKKSNFKSKFRELLFNQLVDKHTLNLLEQQHVINWHSSFSRLYPMITLGDGNCLMHAASLGMWGIQDRRILLRTTVSQLLHSEIGQNVIFPLWCSHRSAQAKLDGYELSASQLAKEWAEELGFIDEPSHYLSELHIFGLAHVLRRPIVVYAEATVHGCRNSLAGIYLPLLYSSAELHSWLSPLPLLYHQNHFVALVTLDGDSPKSAVIPLTTSKGKLLPVHFCDDETEKKSLDQLISCKQGKYLGATVDRSHRPAFQKRMLERYCERAQKKYMEAKRELKRGGAPPTTPESDLDLARRLQSEEREIWLRRSALAEERRNSGGDQHWFPSRDGGGGGGGGVVGSDEGSSGEARQGMRAQAACGGGSGGGESAQQCTRARVAGASGHGSSRDGTADSEFCDPERAGGAQARTVSQTIEQIAEARGERGAPDGDARPATSREDAIGEVPAAPVGGDPADDDDGDEDPDMMTDEDVEYLRQLLAQEAEVDHLQQFLDADIANTIATTADASHDASAHAPRESHHYCPICWNTVCASLWSAHQRLHSARGDGAMPAFTEL